MENFKNRFQKYFSLLWPYIVILLCSFLGFYLVFYTGIIKGHDYKFHIPNVIEQMMTLRQTGELSPISGVLGAGLGNGTRLFYSPLPHLTVTLCAFVMEGMGLTIITAYKFILILSVFLSGVFMYRFAMHFTKDNKIASLITAVIYVVYPYRILDVFTRFAWAETFAFTFLPLFFMGLYDICHIKDDELLTIPFIEVVLGASLLFLSHNLTAFYAYMGGIIYLIFNVKNLIHSFKNYKYWIHCGISVVLIISISSIALFSELELLNSNLYVASQSEAMWADYEHLAEHTEKAFAFSGLLNIKSLSYWFSQIYTRDQLITNVFLFIFGVIGAIVIDKLLSKYKYTKYISFPLGIGFMFMMISIYGRRMEIYMAACAVALLLSFIKYYSNKDILRDDKKDTLYRNPMFYFLLTILTITLILLTCKWAWKLLPEIFYKIQFPWRLWGLFQLYISMLIGLLLSYSKRNSSKFFMCGLAGFLILSNNTLADRNGLYQLQYGDYEVSENFEEKWIDHVDYDLLDAGFAIGACKEYVPQVLLDKDYKSEYPKSLWHKVSRIIRYNFDRIDDYSIKPVYLTGDANIEVTKAFAPKYDMNIEVISDDALIQLPLLYYPGYEIYLNKDSDNSQTLKAINIDGFVSFKLNKGTYQVLSDYVGTPLRKTSVVLTSLGSIGVTGYLIYGLFFEKKLRKRKEKQLPIKEEISQ